MRIVRTIAELREARAGRIALVPTMGALHEGHLSLVRRGREAADQVIVSLFVNPTQFAAGEDFERYPRDLERDANLVAQAGADLLFAPSVDEVYPRRTTHVVVDEVTTEYEGAFRPGHFEGVATVVAKLFNMVSPDIALFGLKDLQQCAVIRRMVEDLNFPIQLRFETTVRESDGLAMSSRNAYLSQEEREVAPLLFQELSATRDRLLAGDSALPLLQEARSRIQAKGFVIDYFDLIDAAAFRPSTELNPQSALVVAAKLGKTRLIDNLLLFPNEYNR